MSTDETAADTDGPEIEMETVGVDEMVRQERVRSIFQAKRDCREQRTKATNEAAVQDDKLGSIIFRNALESYIREVEPLFSKTEQGRRYWKTYDFGTLDLRPRHENTTRTEKQYGVIEDANPKGGVSNTKMKLQGIQSLFDLETPVRVDFNIEVPSTRRGYDHTYADVVSESHIPITSLDKMYAVTNGYLAEIGFGVEVGKAEQHTKLDDDLLDEVEKWRRENL